MHEKVCNNHEQCEIIIPDNESNILKYRHGKKSIRYTFVIDLDFEVMLGKLNSCKNNPEQCFATSIEKHTPCGFSVFIKYPFVESKNNFFYRGPDSMSKFCEIRKDNYQEDINFEQKNIEKVEPIELLLTMEELQSYNIKKISYI